MKRTIIPYALCIGIITIVHKTDAALATQPREGIEGRRIMTYETVTDLSYHIRRQLSSLAFDPHERKAVAIVGSVQQLITDARTTFVNGGSPSFLSTYIQELHTIAIKLSETYQVIIERMQVARTHTDWHEEHAYDRALEIIKKLYEDIDTEIVMYEEYLLKNRQATGCTQRTQRSTVTH